MANPSEASALWFIEKHLLDEVSPMAMNQWTINESTSTESFSHHLWGIIIISSDSTFPIIPVGVQRPNGRDVKSAVAGARTRDGGNLSRGSYTTRPRGPTVNLMIGIKIMEEQVKTTMAMACA
ncbi:hypothetical protein YC2023_084939 [Brassica napus]